MRTLSNMSKPFERWTVLPHGKLTAIEDTLLTVTGTLQMPLTETQRRMTIARLRDGRLAIFSAISLDEDEMHAIERFGEPAYLIVPSGRHRMDLKPWKQRYPKAKVVAPVGARAKVEEIAPVDLTSVDFGDPRVRFVTVAGTGDAEAALEVETDHGLTLVLNEIIFNIASQPGLRGWLFEKLGMTGSEPHIPPLIKLADIKDPAALRDQLLKWSWIKNLQRVILSHGAIVDQQPAAMLAKVAASL
jgi:hypothetical protein